MKSENVVPELKWAGSQQWKKRPDQNRTAFLPFCLFVCCTFFVLFSKKVQDYEVMPSWSRWFPPAIPSVKAFVIIHCLVSNLQYWDNKNIFIELIQFLFYSCSLNIKMVNKSVNKTRRKRNNPQSRLSKPIVQPSTTKYKW